MPTKASTVILGDMGADRKNYTLGFRGISRTYLPSAGYNHHVVATGLRPNTTYFYLVGSTLDGWSEQASFTTPPLIGEKLHTTIVIMGDMGILYSQPTAERITKLVEDGGISSIIQLGDYGYGDIRPGSEYELSWTIFFSLLREAMTRVPFMVSLSRLIRPTNRISLDLVGCTILTIGRASICRQSSGIMKLAASIHNALRTVDSSDRSIIDS